MLDADITHFLRDCMNLNWFQSVRTDSRFSYDLVLLSISYFYIKRSLAGKMDSSFYNTAFIKKILDANTLVYTDCIFLNYDNTTIITNLIDQSSI